MERSTYNKDVPKDLSNEIEKVRDTQIKFTYYVIGLSVASIAYCTNQTNGTELQWTHSFLLAAVLCFFISVLSGISYLRTITGSMNMDILLHQKNNLLIGDDDLSEQEKILQQRPILEAWDELRVELTDANKRNFVCQKYMIILGIVFFVVWRGMEMYIL